MASPQDTAGTVTKHQFEADDGPWSHWKYTVLGDPHYRALGDRLNDLVVADLLCQEEYGTGIVELAVGEGLISEEELESIRDLDPVDPDD